VIGAAMAVHSALGPGLLESAYEKALCHEFGKRPLEFRRQVRIPIAYDGLRIDNAFVLDLIVEGLVVVEIKSVDHVLPVHRTRVRSYLKLTKLPLGLILNFKVAHMRDGITRLANAPESDL
jgi:GxxExxY protein